jgi:hypothetical protein
MVRFKFKSKKLGINSVIQNENLLSALYADIQRLHLLNIYVSHFVKFYYLYSFESNQDTLDIFDKNAVYKFYSILITGKCKETSLQEAWDLFKVTLPGDHLVRHYFRGLSNHGSYNSLQYSVLIKNNILFHYLSHVYHFVSMHFRDEIQSIREIKDKDEKKRKQLYTFHQKDLIVKSLLDTSFETDKLDESSQLFLEQHRSHFTSFLSEAQHDELLLSDEEDVIHSKCEYKKWLKTMIYMSKSIEIYMNTKKEPVNYKILQCIPLYSKLIPGNMTFDSRCLADSCNLYASVEKEGKFTPKTIHNVWDIVFKTTSKAWKYSKKYIFTGLCQTDGVSISLQYIHQDQYEAYVCKKIKRNQVGNLVRNMTDEERVEYHAERDKRQHESRVQQAQNRKEFKKVNKNIKPTSRRGIHYIDSIDKELVSTTKKVYIDPGNNTLLAMIDDQFQTSMSKKEKQQHQLMYTKRYRRHDCGMNTRSKESTFKCQNEPVVDEFHKELSTTRRKSSLLQTYKEYLTIYFKGFTPEILNFFRKSTWWRYQKLQGYGLVKKHETKLLNRIESLFGRDCLYIIGDHSVGPVKGVSSAKGIGLKRLLQSRFTHVYHIDEYNTSKLYWKTHLEGEQWFSKEARSYKSEVPKKKGRRGRGVELKRYKDRIVNEKELDLKGRLIHALKKFQSLKSSICINRDLNAILNMRYIVHYWIEHSIRPPEYCRKPKSLEGPLKRT